MLAGARAGQGQAGGISLVIAAEVIVVVPPWLSSPIVRYVVGLSAGWAVLASIAVAATGTISGAGVPAPSTPPISRLVQIDGKDPCTNELIVLDTRVVVNAATLLQTGSIQSDGVMTLTGWVETGPARDDHNVSAQQHFTMRRTMPLGMSEPAEVRLNVVDRPSLPSTVLSVRLQQIWEGANPELTISDSALGCA